ncbi:hypothetical protein ACQ9AQ_14990, partial [Escherichia coli]|uniref:hypothetical protein n=1 Tax=Escherichia coli TaxID=562 RepID=UPI003D363E32
LMMSLWDALRMNMMISYQELVRTFLRKGCSVAVNAGVSQRLLSRQYRQWCCRDAVFAWTAQ